MNASESSNQCPKCGAAVPAEAAQGLCPKCVLAAVATPTEIASSPASGGEVPSLERVAAAFPQFEIIELIGRGGMGFVFKARQRHLDRYVALKLLSDKLARDPQFAERFNREGRVLARLNHPNIVSVYDFGQTGGFYYLVMEFVDGVNLRQAMRTGKFSPAEALAIVPKICEALQHDRVTTLAGGVDGAVRRLTRSYEVRGLLEKVTSYDNAAVGSGNIVNEVQYAYDNFSQPTTEYQSHSGAVNTGTLPKVQYAYANGNANHIRLTALTYPDARVTTFDYGSANSADDLLSRVFRLKLTSYVSLS